MPGATNPGDILIVGNRRPAGSTGPYGGAANGAGGGRIEGGIYQDEVSENPNGPPPADFDPCDTPEKRFERKADAVAAQTLKDIEAWAAAGNPPTHNGIEEREYGAALWIMPNGDIVAGPLTYSTLSFFESSQNTDPNSAGRGSVTLNVTPPDPYAIYFGSIHTHTPGSILPSGNLGANGAYSGDQGVLAETRANLELNNQNKDLARIYVAAKKTGGAVNPGDPPRGSKMAVYNHLNSAAAISGQEGPEVDPDGQSCPPA